MTKELLLLFYRCWNWGSESYLMEGKELVCDGMKDSNSGSISLAIMPYWRSSGDRAYGWRRAEVWTKDLGKTVVFKRWLGKEESSEENEELSQGEVREENCHGSQENETLTRRVWLAASTAEVKYDKHREMWIGLDNTMAVGIGDLSQRQAGMGKGENGKTTGRSRKSWWLHEEFGVERKKQRGLQGNV